MSDLWTPLSSEVLLDHPRVLVEEARILLPDGHEIDYLLMDTGHDYVTIIAEDDKGDVLTIREHSYPINQSLLQFPEGMSNEGESPEDAAYRELREEAGYLAGKLTVLGSNLHLHRRNTRRNFVVLAQDLEETKAGGGEREEASITRHWMTQSDVWGSIKNGEMIQKNALSSWATYQAFKR